MLVLSRKPHEKLVLPTLETTIEILEIRGNVIRLGISAPDQIRVLRGELASAPQECVAASDPKPN